MKDAVVAGAGLEGEARSGVGGVPSAPPCARIWLVSIEQRVEQVTGCISDIHKADAVGIEATQVGSGQYVGRDVMTHPTMIPLR